MQPHNPTTQFVSELVAKFEGKYYALSNGAWLVCTKDVINAEMRIKKNQRLFRDYWQVYCYDDYCQAARNLRKLVG